MEKMDDFNRSNAISQAYRNGFLQGARAGYSEATKVSNEMISRICDLIEDEEIKALLNEAIFKIRVSNYIGEKP